MRDFPKGNVKGRNICRNIIYDDDGFITNN